MLEDLRSERDWLITGSLVTLAGLALFAALAYTRVLMIPLIIAIFLNTLVGPLVDILNLRFRVPKVLAVIAALLVVVAVLAGLVSLVSIAMGTVLETVQEDQDQLREVLRKGLTWVEERGVHVDRDELTTRMNQQIYGVLGQMVGVFRSILSSTVLIAIFVGFMLASRKPKVRSRGVYAEIDRKVRQYVGTKLFVSLLTAVLVWTTLSIFGLKLALLFGILVFLLNFIPSIGSICATFLPLPIALLQSSDPLWITGVIAIPGTIQIVIGNIVEPLLMGEGLELHPVTILASLALWGLLWGIAGMVLAVPIMASLRILLLRLEFTAPLGAMLAGRLPGSEEH